MKHSISRTKLQIIRLAAGQLARPNGQSITETVAGLVAIQSQDKRSSLLAIRPRCTDVIAADIEKQMQITHNLIRTWCLRGTLHLLLSDDVKWILDLVAERTLKNSERRYKQLELDSYTLSHATALLSDTLGEHGPQTRSEIAAYLETNRISARGQRMPHILRRAALLGLICLGPDRDDGSVTYVLMNDWVDHNSTHPSDGWVQLANRYLGNYGPATVEDFATWSGAYMKEARDAFDALPLFEIDVGGSTLWMLVEQEPFLRWAFEPSIHLIPAYDPLLLGYQSRDWMVRAEHAHQIHPGGGVLRPTVLVNGEATGIWQLVRRKKSIVVKVNLFYDPGPDTLALLEAEITHLGHFLDIDTRLKVFKNS